MHAPYHHAVCKPEGGQPPLLMHWSSGHSDIGTETGVSERPCRTSAYLQIWDKMTKEHGWQHDRPIQLLTDMGREHLALIRLQHGRTE